MLAPRPLSAPRLKRARAVVARRDRTARTFLATAIAVALASSFATSARADDDAGFSWNHSFSIESDLRFRLEDKSVGDWYGSQTLSKGVEREQNTLGAKLSAKLDKFRAVANVDLMVYGYHDKLEGIGALTQIDEVQPYRFDVNELYVAADSFILKGLDLKIGQQIVQWGVGDQFNPTNNLNSDDLRDPLLFGKQAGNFMIRADYYVTEDLSWSAVLVPLFRPALLPDSAPLNLSIDKLPFVDEKLRWRIAGERAGAESQVLQHPTLIDKTTIDMPTPNFENMQASFRLAWTLAQQDFALSYYRGRSDFPAPVKENTHQDKSFQGCDPVEPLRCAQGLLKTDVVLEYPRMHVYGFNVTGELPKFGEKTPGLGYRFEGALIVPDDKTKMTITQDALDLAIPQPAGEYDYDNDGKPGGPRPVVVDDTAFAKWTLGLDYTFGEHVYVNLQWVHGLPDEFGAGDWISPGESVRLSDVTGTRENAAVICALSHDGTKCAHEITRPRIGDFIVLGADFHFLEDAALARIFTVFEMNGYKESFFDQDKGERVTVTHPFFTPEGFSAAIYPEFDYNFGNGFQVGAGALFLCGKDYTKFGDPGSGGSLAFLRASYAL